MPGNDGTAVQAVKLDSATTEAATSVRAASSAPARLREARFSDHGAVAALQARNGLGTKCYDDWCSLWARNPVYLQTRDDLPIGWVLQAGDGRIVGFLGNLPLAYKFQRRELNAATAHSWVVDDGYRGHSIALLDTFLKQRSVDLFVFATVNSAAESVLRAFRLKRIPVPGWDMARFWITGYRGFARGAMAARSVPFPGLCGPPVAGALWARDRFFREPNHTRIENLGHELGTDLKAEVCTEFDARFDRFWTALEKQNRHRLLAVRDRETLAWHYGPAMRRGSLWITAVSVREHIVAYWAVDRQDHAELGLKRLRFVDFQALAGFERLLRLAVASTLRQCRQEGMHIADNLGSWLARYKVPGTVAPYRRQMKSWLFYYRASGGDLAAQLDNPDVWMPSSYDGDASL